MIITGISEKVATTEESQVILPYRYDKEHFTPSSLFIASCLLTSSLCEWYLRVIFPPKKSATPRAFVTAFYP